MQYVIYYRVSTQRQGVSGLGLEAQREQVSHYLKSKANIEVLGEFTEIESGKKSNRIELSKAVTLAKKNKATLLVAKLDRLARNVRLFLDLLDQVKLEFADLPSLTGGTSDTRLMLTQLSAMAEWEASKISERTKSALQAKKAQGFKLGIKGKDNIKATNAHRQEQADQFAQAIAPTIRPLVDTMSQRQIVKYLNEQGIKSPTGKDWVLCTVQNVIKRVLQLPPTIAPEIASIEPQDTAPTKGKVKPPKQAKKSPQLPQDRTTLTANDSLFGNDWLNHDWRLHGLSDEQISKLRYYKERFVKAHERLFKKQIEQGMTADKIFNEIKPTLKDPVKAIKYYDIDFILQEKFRQPIY